MSEQCGTCGANILSCRSGYREYCFQLRAYVKPNELRCGGKHYQEDSEEDLLAWRDKPNWKLPEEEPQMTSEEESPK